MATVYAVTDYEGLRNLCIKNNWFTEGTNKQYEKLFYANEHGCTIEEIATIIWLCSDDVARRDVVFSLEEARAEYYKRYFNITSGRLFRFFNNRGHLLECTFSQFCDALTDLDDDNWDVDSIIRVEATNPYRKSEVIWEKEIKHNEEEYK